MTEPTALATIRKHIRAGGHLVLFLDYDGTLVPIAPTPAEAQPDEALKDLLTDLARIPNFDTIILSGRPLSTLQAMLPISGLTLAGTYGVEVQRQGAVIMRDAALYQILPFIKQVKNDWDYLIGERGGFLLEDRGLSVALHARWAEPGEADFVLEHAQASAIAALPNHRCRILTGERFLEVVPATARKEWAVEWLLAVSRSLNVLPIYFGDDDRDEEAFAVVRRRGGIPIGVGTRFPLVHALEHVSSPETVRDWLKEFLAEVW